MKIPEKDTLCVYCGTDLEKRDAMNDVYEAAKSINEGIRGDYMNAADPTVLKTWIRHDRISAIHAALEKLEGK